MPVILQSYDRDELGHFLEQNTLHSQVLQQHSKRTCWAVQGAWAGDGFLGAYEKEVLRTSPCYV